MKRARLATVIAVTSVSLALLLIGLFGIFYLNMDRWIGRLRAKMEIEVFLDPTVKQEKIDQLRKSIQQIEGIESVQFISKEKAAKRFKQEFGQDIFDIIENNPLPPSFVIHLKKGYRTYMRVSAISGQLQKLDAVDEIVFQKQLLQIVDRYIQIVYLGTILIGLMITFIAFVLIYNTIRLTIYARKDIISIMRLVGATERFVRRPFVVEGMAQGLIGAAIASILLFYFIKFVKTFIYPYLATTPYLFLILLGLGWLLGMISSRLSVGKHLQNV